MLDVVVELVLPGGVVVELVVGVPALVVEEELPVPAGVLVTPGAVPVAAALVVLVVVLELELLALELLGMFGYGGVWQQAL